MEQLGFWGPLAVMLGIVAWGVGRQARSNRRQILRRVLERVEGAFAPERSGLLSDVVVGQHMGRELTLKVGTKLGVLSPRGLRYPVSARLSLRHAPDISLRIRRDRGLAAFEKAAGLVRDLEVAGGGKFDRNYVVEAEDAPAQAPLADEDVRRAVDELLVRWDLDDIRIRRGELIVSGDSSRLGANMLRGLLVELDVLAHAYDRRPAVEVGVKKRFFWVGGCDATPRCPFCHDTIESNVDVSSCGRCETMLHSECFDENGGCPILGCGGRGANPVGPLKL